MRHYLKRCVLCTGCLLAIVWGVCRSEAANYVVDAQSSSTDWAGAEWKNYPDPPVCVPTSPLTAMQNAVAGDVVYFRGGEGGTYDLLTKEWTIPGLNPANSGTDGSPIVFRNYPGEVPHLRNTMTYAQSNPDGGRNGKYEEPLIGANGRSWIVWNGFKLSAPDASGKVTFYGANHCTLENCEIVGVLIPEVHCPTNYDGIRLQDSTYITIRNCYIHGIESDQYPRGAGIKSYWCKYTVVERCTFEKTSYAIHDKQAGYHNRYSMNLIVQDAAVPGSGIIVMGKDGDIPAADTIDLQQNIIVLSKPGSAIECTNTCINVSISQTVIHAQPKSWGLNLGIIENNQIWNTIIVNTETTEGLAMRWVGANAQPTYSDYNCFAFGERFTVRDYQSNKAVYGNLETWKKSGEILGGGNPDTHSLNKDPLFVNPSARDFRLQGGSPCKGTGKGGKDMGVYPDGPEGVVIGYREAIERPAAPQNLRIVK